MHLQRQSFSLTIAAHSRYATTLRTLLQRLALTCVAVHIIRVRSYIARSSTRTTAARFMAGGALLGVPFSFAEFPLTAPDGLNLGTWMVDELQTRETRNLAPDGTFDQSTADTTREFDFNVN